MLHRMVGKHTQIRELNITRYTKELHVAQNIELHIRPSQELIEGYKDVALGLQRCSIT